MCAGSPTVGTSSSFPSPPDQEFETDTASSQRGLEAADWREVSADLDRNATDHGESSRPSRRGSYVSTRVLGEPSSPTLTLVALLLDEVKVLWE